MPDPFLFYGELYKLWFLKAVSEKYKKYFLNCPCGCNPAGHLLSSGLDLGGWGEGMFLIKAHTCCRGTAVLPLGPPRTRCAARGGGRECRGRWGWGCEWGIKGLTPPAALPVSGTLLGRGRVEGWGGGERGGG